MEAYRFSKVCFICEGKFTREIRASNPPFYLSPENEMYYPYIFRLVDKTTASFSLTNKSNAPPGSLAWNAESYIYSVNIKDNSVCLDCFDLLIAFPDFVDRFLEQPIETNETIRMIKSIRNDRKLSKSASKVTKKKEVFSKSFIEQVKKMIQTQINEDLEDIVDDKKKKEKKSSPKITNKGIEIIERLLNNKESVEIQWLVEETGMSKTEIKLIALDLGMDIKFDKLVKK